MFDTTKLGINHVQVIVRGMYELASCDGLHESEKVLMLAFYEECRRETGALTSFAEVVARPFDADEARTVLDTEELRVAFLHSCLLLAHADGSYSAAERAKIESYAAVLGMAGTPLALLTQAAGDALMQSVSRISNTDALQQVAASLQQP